MKPEVNSVKRKLHQFVPVEHANGPRCCSRRRNHPAPVRTSGPNCSDTSSGNSGRAMGCLPHADRSQGSFIQAASGVSKDIARRIEFGWWWSVSSIAGSMQRKQKAEHCLWSSFHWAHNQRVMSSSALRRAASGGVAPRQSAWVSSLGGRLERFGHQPARQAFPPGGG